MMGFFNERKLVIETRKAVFSQPDGLRVGDVALCCACGKAILLTRCYRLVYFQVNYTLSFGSPPYSFSPFTPSVQAKIKL